MQVSLQFLTDFACKRSNTLFRLALPVSKVASLVSVVLQLDMLKQFTNAVEDDFSSQFVD